MYRFQMLSGQPDAQAWRDFFEIMQDVEVPDEFMAELPMNVLPQDRPLFDEES